jgi:hypothetical protein
LPAPYERAVAAWRALVLLIRAPDDPRAAWALRYHVEATLQHRVATGPFAGMKYESPSVGSAFLPKLLGTYEQELHPWIRRLLLAGHDVVMDVGCAEGYYVVDFARHLALTGTAATVLGYDTDPQARERTMELARANGVEGIVSVHAACDAQTLAVFSERRVLVICDIEGGEETLLGPSRAPRLQRADILVEVHDGPGKTRIRDTLLNRFSGSHDIEHVAASTRSLPRGAFQLLLPTGRWARHALDEGRHYGIDWLLLTARQPTIHTT